MYGDTLYNSTAQSKLCFGRVQLPQANNPLRSRLPPSFEIKPFRQPEILPRALLVYKTYDWSLPLPTPHKKVIQAMTETGEQ